MKCNLCGYEEWPNATTWKFRFNTPAISGNALGGNSRTGSGFKYRAVRRRFERDVARHGVPGATVLRRLCIIRRYRAGCRDFDYGNLVWGFKPLVDAITRAKWLVDDSPRWCQDIYRQFPSGTTKDYIEIELSEP